MVALIGDEHVDLTQPYPALPNLVHLSLMDSSITDPGCIKLSQSQLLDQLEYLDVASSSEPRLIQIGNATLLTTPLYSNMKKFRSPNETYDNTSVQTTYPHLSNSNMEFYNHNKIEDQFWNAE